MALVDPTMFNSYENLPQGAMIGPQQMLLANALRAARSSGLAPQQVAQAGATTATDAYSGPDASAIEYRKTLAKALMERANKPLEQGRMAGGFVVPINPLEGLGKLAQTYVAGRANAKAMEEEKAYKNATAQALLGAANTKDLPSFIAALNKGPSDVTSSLAPTLAEGAFKRFNSPQEVTLTPAEIASVGLPVGSSAQRDPVTGKITVLDKGQDPSKVPLEPWQNADGSINQPIYEATKKLKTASTIISVAGANERAAANRDAGFTDEMGNLMAAISERGISLPTGFRSKAQQVQLYKGLLARNPDKSPEEIANLLATGQIDFGAQKKETQIAAGIAGRISYAQNELQETIPLVRQASSLVPRTSFVPLNKLMQMGEDSISDPNLRELKIYINSVLNAYDVLSARGGTDMAKRAATRSLLLSADGPEALEAGLKAFQNEAAAAARAAEKSVHLPKPGSNNGQPSVAPSAGQHPTDIQAILDKYKPK